MKIIYRAFIERKKKFLIGFLGLLVFFQFVSLSSNLAVVADHQAIISSFDDDAGMAVYNAYNTKWWNDNGNHAYGPFYYRVVHTFARLVPAPITRPGLTDREQIELAHHFALMAVSLLALFGIAWLVSRLISKRLEIRLLAVLLFVPALLNVKVWSMFIFRAHPDMLFCFFIAWATERSIRYLQYPHNKHYFWTSAFLWGTAAATKLTIVLWVPAFIALFIPPLKKHNIIKMFQYAGWMLFGFFAVGFPQNFVVHKKINFLLYQSQFSGKPSFKSITKFLQLYSEQSLVFIIIFLLLYLLFGDRKKQVFNWRIVGVFVFPFLFLISREVYSQHNYYTLPLVAATPFVLYHLLNLFPLPSLPKFKGELFFVFLICVLSYWLFPFTNTKFEKVTQNQMLCRNEIRETYDFAKVILRKSPRSIMTPYFPISPGYGNNVIRDYDLSYRHLKKGDVRFLFLNKTFYQRFLVKEINVSTSIDTTNPNSSRQFFETFADKNRAMDKYGQSWEKIYQNTCGYEVWKRTAS